MNFLVTLATHTADVRVIILITETNVSHGELFMGIFHDLTAERKTRTSDIL